MRIKFEFTISLQLEFSKFRLDYPKRGFNATYAKDTISVCSLMKSFLKKGYGWAVVLDLYINREKSYHCT